MPSIILRYVQNVETSVLQDQQYVWCQKFARVADEKRPGRCVVSTMQQLQQSSLSFGPTGMYQCVQINLDDMLQNKTLMCVT